MKEQAAKSTLPESANGRNLSDTALAHACDLNVCNPKEFG